MQVMLDASESKIEASIGFSRKWNARDAGREVARSAIKNLKTPPSFFLLFSTIHYRDHGGFKEFLDGVWDVLPKGTPLIGGTFAGFINNHGCYARGASALAVSYPYMDMAVGIGKNAKAFPKKAAKQCANSINKNLKRNKYENKFIINVISGPKIPKRGSIPFISNVNLIKSNLLGALFSSVMIRIFPYFGIGPARENYILQKFSELMPDYFFIGGDSADDGNFYSDYQFIRNEVHSNSIVAIGCNTNLPLFVKSAVGLHPTNKIFKVTGTTSDKRIITRIENKPAKEYFFRNILGISENQIKEFAPFYYKFAYYFPLTFEADKEITSGIAGFFGKNIILEHEMIGDEIRILSITGKEIMENIDRVFPNDKNELPFVLMFSSAIYSFVLGNKTFDIKENLDKKIQNIPYLMVLPMLENVKMKNCDPKMRVYSLNVLSIKDDEKKR